MMRSVHFVGVLLLALTSVQPSDQRAFGRDYRLRAMRDSRRARQVTESTPEPATDAPTPGDTPSFTYPEPPTTTPPYPPPDPNDACRGCPTGQVCVEVWPPCTPPPPPPECFEEEPDPNIDCDYHPYGGMGYRHCEPVPICVDYRYYSWYM